MSCGGAGGVEAGVCGQQPLRESVCGVKRALG